MKIFINIRNVNSSKPICKLKTIIIEISILCLFFGGEDGLGSILNALKTHDLRRIVERLLLKNNLPPNY